MLINFSLFVLMAIFFTSLNTGSNGNCFYVGNKDEAVLVDAGLSCKETEIRMSRLNLSMNKVKAIFISHEHSDHIRGLEILAKKYQLPVYISPATLGNARLKLPEELVKSFSSYQKIAIGKLEVSAFPKLHDAAEPHSFIVRQNNTTVGVFTDIGSHCKHVIDNFKLCNAAFLEANYDDEMLDKGNYPYYLKNRIRGDHGHLSNQQALDLFTNYKPDFMSHLLLSHLSKDNNCPKLVHQLFSEKANGTTITVASRYQETEVFSIEI